MTAGLPPGETDAAEDSHDEVVPREAEGLSTTILCTLALVLIALAPIATRPQPPGRAWFLAPANWPLINLGIVLIAGGALVWQFFILWRGAADRKDFWDRAFWSFGGMGRALEYSLWFCLYLWSVGQIGFAISTLIFLQFTVWRSGLRGWKWMLTALLVALAIILVFRVGIGLWFPLAPLFRLMPAWVGNTFGGVL